MPSLNLLVIRAQDSDRLCRFYTALGLEFVREQHGSGPVHHASRVGGSTFEIYPRRHDEPTTAGARLGFSVSSLDSTLAALSGEDGAVLCGPAQTPWGRRAVVCDPEGHKVELIEAVQDDRALAARRLGFSRAAADGISARALTLAGWKYVTGEWKRAVAKATRGYFVRYTSKN